VEHRRVGLLNVDRKFIGQRPRTPSGLEAWIQATESLPTKRQGYDAVGSSRKRSKAEIFRRGYRVAGTRTRREQKPRGARSERGLNNHAGHRTRSEEKTPEVEGDRVGAGNRRLGRPTTGGETTGEIRNGLATRDKPLKEKP
jgi:hypothetical protein